MNTIIKTTIAILTILFFMVSCSKDENAPTPDPTPVAIQYKVKEIRNASNVVEYAYEYNAQNQETKMIESNDRTVTKFYNTAGILIKSSDSGFSSQSG